MLRRLKKVVTASLLVMLPTAASAEVLFSDTFDNKPDWSVPYATSSQGCSKESGCTNKPEGYYGFYISPSVITPNGHGLHLNSTNKRGASGKGLTFWDQTNGTYNWTSGMQLGVDFPARKEIYVRYWMKMQPGYKYNKASGSSMMRKLNHISHYTYNGRPFTFFKDGGHHPTTINTVGFANNNASNLKNSFAIRPDKDYNGTQLGTIPTTPLSDPSSAGVSNYFDLPDDALPRGNYSGTGTEYNSPGMIADGNWHCLEFYLKSNTIRGVGDGAYKFWLDGVVQIDATGLLFRDSTSTLPEDIWNFVHIGGNAYNPFLGVGVKGEQWYAVDDVVISTTYSGPPAKPVNLKASAVSSSAIKLTWTAGTNNATYPLNGYRIYYGTDPNNLIQTMTVGNVTQAEVAGLTAGKTYYFSVAGFNKGSQDTNENESIHSVKASAATSATATAPAPADTTAPVASISAPVSGAVVSGTVPVTATASDNVGVSKVEFYVNSSIIGVIGSAPYTLSWNTTGRANGTYTVTAKAYDAAGNVGTKSVSVSVSNAASPTTDTTLPTVNVFTMPSTATSSTVAVTGFSGSDNVAVTGYQITESSTKPAATSTAWRTSAPTSFTFAGTGLRTAYAWVKDAAGNVSAARSASVTIGTVSTSDTTAPSVAITAPGSGSKVSGVAAITASATDNVGVTKVDYYINGVLRASDSTAPYTWYWDTKASANASYTMTAKAFDAAGNSRTSSAVTLYVANSTADATAPSVAITAPASGSRLSGVAAITASASDNVGVAKVEYYINGVLRASDSTAPYTWYWDTTASANTSYTVTAKAFDAAGNSRTSSAVTLYVANSDTTLPTVTLTSPISTTLYGGTLTVKGTATDNVGVTKMQVHVDGSHLLTTTNSYVNVSKAVPVGTHTVIVKAYDAANNIRSVVMKITRVS